MEFTEILNDKRTDDKALGKKDYLPKTTVDKSSPIAMAFQVFQTELDVKYDRYERLVKLSRDVTIESKRTISMLQRVPGSEKDESVSILEKADKKLQEIRKNKFRQIAVELKNEDPFQFLRAYSPGVQEYVEAVSLLYYLKDESLVSLGQVTDDMKFQIDEGADTSTKCQNEEGEDNTSKPQDNNITVFISPVDYVLGLADLTGELMRVAINSIGSGDKNMPFKLCDFIRTIYDSFLSLEQFSRELSRKLSVLRQSLKKVETACYTIQVRGSEIPTHMLADAIIADPEPRINEPSEPSDM